MSTARPCAAPASALAARVGMAQERAEEFSRSLAHVMLQHAHFPPRDDGEALVRLVVGPRQEADDPGSGLVREAAGGRRSAPPHRALGVRAPLAVAPPRARLVAGRRQRLIPSISRAPEARVCVTRADPRGRLDNPRRDRHRGPIMGKLTIEILPIFSDNYVYLLRDAARGVTGVVDPGDAAPVLARLDETGWKLDWILSTHHHQDHTGGNLEVKRRTGCRIAGPAGERDAIPGIDSGAARGRPLRAGRRAGRRARNTRPHARPHQLLVRGRRRAVLRRHAVRPGLRPRVRGHAAADVGVALEAGGAARRRPGSTAATSTRCRTRASPSPSTPTTRARAPRRGDRALRAAGKPTIPSTLAVERETNPFLRAGDPPHPPRARPWRRADAEVFAEIRRRKDRF